MSTAASATLGRVDPRLIAIERMAPARLQAIEALRAKHRRLCVQPGAAPWAGLDPSAVLARIVPSAAQLQDRCALISRLAPASAEAIRGACADVKAHRFDLLGTRMACPDGSIDWHCDHRVGKHYRPDIDYAAMGADAFALLIDRDSGAELKFPWDLSNFHWLPSLALGRFLFADRACAEAFASDWGGWMEANRPFLGVNWFCPMNIAIRAMNVAVALSAFAGDLGPDLMQRSLRCLFHHGLGIMANLEVGAGGKRNNHYLTNVMGMYHLGWLFRDLPLGAEWLDFATSELEAEVRYQFRPDGMVFEDSTSYHRLSTEMVLLCAITAERNGRSLSKEARDRLRCALEFTRAISAADGCVPQFGDNDNGRILQFHGYGSTPTTDHRHLLAVGGEFLREQSLIAAGAGAEIEAIALLGSWSPAERSAPPATESLRFRDGGFAIHRHEGVVLVVRAGTISATCAGGHAHCDQFAFTLHGRHGPLFVDPGSYRYSSDFAARNAFRSVAYHNTVQVDRLEMHQYDPTTFEGLWWMVDGTAALIDDPGTDDGSIWRFAGRHHGYAAADCLTGRRIAWDHRRHRIAIEDSVVPLHPGRPIAGASVARSRLLLAPGLTVAASAGPLLILDGERAVARVDCDGADQVRIVQRWYSPAYGSRDPALQIEAAWRPAQRSALTTTVHLIADDREQR